MLPIGYEEEANSDTHQTYFWLPSYPFTHFGESPERTGKIFSCTANPRKIIKKITRAIPTTTSTMTTSKAVLTATINDYYGFTNYSNSS